MMANFPDCRLIPGFFTAEQRMQIDAVYHELETKAHEIVRQTQAENCSLADFYRRQSTLIVVPEKQSPELICRMEYLNGTSDAFNQFVTLPVQRRLEELVGAELALFKDKCNVKVPRGGAFPPHQDAPAYLNFGPTIFITAGIMLDALSAENGCLHMATNYRQLNVGIARNCATSYGDYPLFEYFVGGARNGDIVDEVQAVLQWETIGGQAGDLLVFNSFIPHFSHINASRQHRRVLYLTFNLLSEGAHYQRYYQKKWQDYSNPQFHISTPTMHAALPH
ncbi:phytanoyl-CoA dioxygenase family protein [Dickeya dianthicola]|uniref:phytanoyl-CoA dioxygenase family protein n=1 Tax=Dickeya dianthicola TaxID=204039 RepID=UPI0018671047|nr:phytanoyl-CoA dioxygenase family protein [Dickeya dianthicola]MCI4187328.1 phytanoyl-CoA dioxygenase family protein [Dickeya dianthicola]QOL13993.1 phytanoyl-CoA dioxygenase family protein [Dickeya dianthicola]